MPNVSPQKLKNNTSKVGLLITFFSLKSKVKNILLEIFSLNKFLRIFYFFRFKVGERAPHVHRYISEVFKLYSKSLHGVILLNYKVGPRLLSENRPHVRFRDHQSCFWSFSTINISATPSESKPCARRRGTREYDMCVVHVASVSHGFTIHFGSISWKRAVGL